MNTPTSREVVLDLEDVSLGAELNVPHNALGLVIFAHGSGSSRQSPRNQFVARVLRDVGIGTLLFDLLTEDEEQADARTPFLRFDIPFLARRLVGVTRWVLDEATTRGLILGYFGASTGAAAALVAAAKLRESIQAVVSRGGRPDLAGSALEDVQAPTLLLVGAHDSEVLALNEGAYNRLRCPKALRIIQGATHLFEEPGTLDQVARMASEWFAEYLRSQKTES